ERAGRHVEVAHTRYPRRVRDVVEHMPVCLTGPATRDAFDELIGWHIDEQCLIDPLAVLGERDVEHFGLISIPGKAVEDDALFGVPTTEAVEEHPDGDEVRHKLTPLHVLLRLESDWRLRPDCSPKQVARGDVWEAETLR